MRKSAPYMLAFDIGTNGCKGILINFDGFLVNKMVIDFQSITFEQGYIEQDPMIWWRAIKDITLTLLKRIEPDDVAGIGICGTMGTTLPVDKDGRPLRYAMLYIDPRAVDQTKKLLEHFDRKDLYNITGNPVSPVYSLPKWMWIMEHEEKIFRKTSRFLQPKDFLIHKLTSEMGTDFVDASATMAFDVKKRVWANEILEYAGIPLEKMPNPRPSSSISGELTIEASSELGLKSGTPVIVGCGDTGAILVGSRAIEDRSATIYLGSAAEINVTTDKPIFDPEARIPLRCHAIPGKWFNSASAMTSGTALKWFMNHFAAEGESYAEMDRKAINVPTGSRGTIFLPYLSGERVPIWDTEASGAFIGLSTSNDKISLYKAILEGVAYSLRAIKETYYDIGIDIKKIRIAGGGAKSRLWKQIIADVLALICIDIEQPQEISAVGVAKLIAISLGSEKSFKNALGTAARIKGFIQPNRSNSALYDEYYRAYLKCYPALISIMHDLVDLRDSAEFKK